MTESKPSLLDIAINTQRPVGPKCAVSNALDAKPELKDQINDLISHTRGDPRDQPEGIVVRFSVAEAILQEIGLDVKADAISRHRHKKCGCGR